ncbi:hypothetical protein ELQ35_17190 [Peribacillus cavernae]|uniref:Uncharacterized protein n=1 Tax=Peribacillus cavernae TaxID=1674310 RepID=A0A3S1B2D6_9BACI|nr:hypothetical protein [Peribacillus cavernae]MDQ0219493.1 hypothetical protein [Peribacillus cavernae]RUQ27090.1 hypothetical protein ELQ35_17190 [Peribacillus cavernae]
MMYDLFTGRFEYLNKLFARSLLQGFSLAAFWSPYFAGIIAFVGLFLALFILEKWLHFNVLLLISILAISYSIAWSLAIKKIKQYVFSLKDYFTNVALNVHTESIMIISATFFSQRVLLTNFPAFLSSLF